MGYNFDQAIKELQGAVATIEKDAEVLAIEKLVNDDKAMGEFCRENFGADISGIAYGGTSMPNLTVYIYDTESGSIYLTIDPIERLFKEFPNPFGDEDSRSIYAQSIAALQSGIDRIKAYEAERRAAQS